MRVLVASKFWYRRGGLERVMFDEVQWLEGAGHEVAHFSTTHPLNDESPWAPYFVPYLELGDSGGLSATTRLQAAARMFSNPEAARRFDRLLADFQPDVVHVHGIHRQISPSILEVATQRGVAVVQTLHDFHHVCPADVLLYKGREVCEPRRCGRLWYGAAVAGRCVRGSLVASTLSAAETGWQRARRVYERNVQRFISPSNFLTDRMREGGWEMPIDPVPNAVPLRPARQGAGQGFAVIGRLATEKGVAVACDAASQAGVALTVAGEGPLGDELRQRYPLVEFTGRLSGAEVDALVGRSRAVIVPSKCYENAPMAVLEAMAKGVPVIASRIGGIPELVEDSVEGLLVASGDSVGFAAAIRRLSDDAGRAESMGSAARERVKREFSPPTHLQRLIQSYDKAREQVR